MKLTIEVGDALFEFTSFQNWVNTARRKFERAGVKGYEVICLDTKGRICERGLHFKVARDDGSFPVTVYAIRDALAEVAATETTTTERGTAL